MKAFLVSGHFQMGQNMKQPFVKQMAAEDEATVRERIMSDLGSRHGVPRRRIEITEIRDLRDDEDVDPIVRHMMTKG